MERRQLALTSAGILPLLLLHGCGLFSGAAPGPSQVQDLVGSVENVYVESELASKDLHAAMQSLQKLTAPDFKADPVLAFMDLDKAVKASEQQEQTLKNAVGPMKSASAPVFKSWEEDLKGIDNQKLHELGVERLKRARECYQAVVTAIDPALATYTSINKNLREYVLFLGHDLNPTSLGTIRTDVQGLADQAATLDHGIGQCLVAARAYVDLAALPRNGAYAAPNGESRGNERPVRAPDAPTPGNGGRRD